MDSETVVCCFICLVFFFLCECVISLDKLTQKPHVSFVCCYNDGLYYTTQLMAFAIEGNTFVRRLLHRRM